MIILGVQIADNSGLKGMRGKIGGIQKQALHETAQLWHRTVLAGHFAPGAAAGYGYKPRSRFYLSIIKPFQGQGQGKFILLILKGMARRWLQNFVTITGTKDRQTIRMKAPGYFTRPFIGSFTDKKSGKTKRITNQPDKPAELVKIGSGDKQILRDFMQDRIIQLFKTARAGAARKVTINP